ncbi:MAG TPA: hypothetical protein VEU97_14155, partial [Ktedonobacteraceae bacterium]|nr:hypothetical protein [Ktedonobacteraceae bacterium]
HLAVAVTRRATGEAHRSARGRACGRRPHALPRTSALALLLITRAECLLAAATSGAGKNTSGYPVPSGSDGLRKVGRAKED